MKRLILHIGTVKTGSTYIQEALFDNRKMLQERQIGTPFSNKNHFQLAYVGAEETQKSRFTNWVLRGTKDPSNFLEQLGREVEVCASRFETTYITSEFLTQSVTSQAGINRIAQLISGIFDKVVIVCFVRRPEFLSIPLYSTAVRAGRTRCFQPSEAIGHNSQMQSFQLQLWRKNFQQADVHAIPYVESQERTEVVRRFAKLLAPTNQDLWKQMTLPESSLNASLTSIGLEVLRALNSDIAEPAKFARHKVVTAVESATCGFWRACLTEREYLIATENCAVESRELERFLDDNDRAVFSNQQPTEFATVSQTLIGSVYDQLIQDARRDVIQDLVKSESVKI